MICLLSYMPVIIQYKETPKSLHLPLWAGSSLAACAGRRGCLGTSLFPHLCFSSFPSCLFASVSDPSRFETGKRRNSNRQEKPYFWLRCCAHQVSVLSRLGRESRADSLMSCFCGSMAAPRVELSPVVFPQHWQGLFQPATYRSTLSFQLLVTSFIHSLKGSHYPSKDPCEPIPFNSTPG